MHGVGLDASLLHPTTACPTPAFTCKARLNDRPRSGRTSAPCLVQGFVGRCYLPISGHRHLCGPKKAIPCRTLAKSASSMPPSSSISADLLALPMIATLTSH